MKIESIRSLDGMNIHSYKPVIVMRLDLENYAETSTRQIGNYFAESLFKLLPGLYKHKCSKGYEGGFWERVHEGTLLGHVIEHVCLELQHLAGIGTYYGKTRYAGRPGLYNIIFEYKAKYAAEFVAREAVAVVAGLMQRKRVDIAAVIKNIQQIVQNTELGPSTQALVTAAKCRHIPVRRQGKNSLLQLGYGAALHHIQATITDKTCCLAVDIACNKALTKQRLENVGLPTPYGKTFRTQDEAVSFALDLNCPVVVKPLDGNQGKGVSLALTKKEEIEAAFQLASRHSDEVMVEEYVKGQHYRCTVVDGRLVAAALRIPAHIIGDGIHTISELVELENKNPLRGEGHEKPLTYLQIDDVAKLVLKMQDYDLFDVPKAGQRVYLRQNANLSTGGIAYDVTDDIHADNKYLVEMAAQVIGLDIAGVDCVMRDISKSYKEQESAIIEINAAPGIRMHHYPAGGKARDVAGAIVDYLFPQGQNGRIPLITVTGTNGKTTTVRLISQILKMTGLTVGMTTTDGVYVNDTCLKAGDMTGPISAEMILTNKNVEVAVLELARGGLIRGGLYFDESDVAIVTNISEDHLGQDGVETLDDLVFVKKLVVEAVKKDGHVILNADDNYCSEFADVAQGEIIYISCDRKNATINKHLAQGGRAVCVEERQIVLLTGDKKLKLGQVAEIPLSFSGKAVHNVYNILSATAAGWVYGVDPKLIMRALSQFKPDLEYNPGRQNIYKLPGDVTVMIDYAHNRAGYRAILELVKKLHFKSIIGVICAPGDRDDRYIYDLGIIAGQALDQIYIKEDRDLRGRTRGEVAQLLYQGCVQHGASKTISIVLSEEEAIKQACFAAQAGDLVLVLYEKLSPCFAAIEACAEHLVKKSHFCKVEVATSS